jgi:hypothetical protein
LTVKKDRIYNFCHQQTYNINLDLIPIHYQQVKLCFADIAHNVSAVYNVLAARIEKCEATTSTGKMWVWGGGGLRNVHCSGFGAFAALAKANPPCGFVTPQTPSRFVLKAAMTMGKLTSLSA